MKDQLTTHSSRSAIFAWCLYDWANSAFPTVITTFIFAAYFTQSVALNVNLGTAQWGYTITISGILIALASPIFGAIADHYGRRKPWLAAFSVVAVVAAACLWWVKPDSSSVPLALTLVIIGTVGFDIALVFYNAMLHDLVPKSYYGRLSGWGWGLGYLGGLACLLVALAIVASDFGKHAKHAEPIRVCGPLVAAWFVVFALPLFRYTPDQPQKHSLSTSVSMGLSQFIQSLKKIISYPSILLFLIAHMIYIDGLNTIFAFGGVYAAGTFGFNTQEIILFGIATNITAGLGALGFAWIDDWIGPKTTILLSIMAIFLLGIGVLLAPTAKWFWIFSVSLTFFIGPVQASSRSLLTRLVPEGMVTEVFGLYAFSGKVTAFIGPWALGMATLYWQSQRVGMATTLVFMIIGAILLQKVKVQHHGN